MRARSLKRLPDGRALLNVGCGTRMHWDWNNVDFSPYARLRSRPALARAMRAAGLISDLRWRRLADVDPDIVAWDLRRGIPFPDDTFDVVYHSHFLEHLPREAAVPFLRACGRVLRRGGVLRVVVPDLERAANEYLAALASADRDPASIAAYDRAMDALLGQMTSLEVTGTSLQVPAVRRLEKALRGDAAATGQLHRWMYDRHSLARRLIEAGLRDPVVRSATGSAVDGWTAWQLDTNEDGSVYKPESLYMEAVK
jgi:SAM-dependent methyltransferase